MILIPHRDGEPLAQISVSDDKHDWWDVANTVRAYLHPDVQIDDRPFHAAMKLVAEEWAERARQKRKLEAK